MSSSADKALDAVEQLILGDFPLSDETRNQMSVLRVIANDAIKKMRKVVQASKHDADRLIAMSHLILQAKDVAIHSLLIPIASVEEPDCKKIKIEQTEPESEK